MNGSRKLRTVRTVRLGDLLYDEQKRLMTLCRSCERHFMSIQTFHSHLANCPGLKDIVSNEPLSYDESKRETRLVNGRQEMHIYDIEAVKNANSSHSAIIDWEAELEDPRWYTDVAHSTTKSALAKENALKLIEVKHPVEPPETEAGPAKRLRSVSQPRRPILAAQQQRTMRSSLPSPPHPTVKTKRDTLVVPNVMEDLKRLQDAHKKKSSPPAHRTASPPKPSPPPMVSIPMDGTQMILNKLRACGVEVKRGNTLVNVTPPVEKDQTKNQEALEIMRKLQSKGIKCTKVSKN
ncbi:hypothetical protein KR009_001408 [Drosophila setifemur]|nr:hypothetical protein KR009_001408 [Drosophila setifemur]